MTTVVISQPMYFPWPGFFEQMAMADVYIWLDDVQFSKGSFTNRIQVKLPSGQHWMSIPLKGRGTMTCINDLAAANDHWMDSHKELLRECSRTAPHRNEAMTLFNSVGKPVRLVDHLIASAENPACYLNITPKKVLRASELKTEGASWQRVLAMTKQVGGTRYLTGHGAASYLDHVAFEDQGVEVQYIDYSLTPWPQAYGDFTPYVTILDLIAMTGREAASYLHPQTVSWRHFLGQSKKNE